MKKVVESGLKDRLIVKDLIETLKTVTGISEQKFVRCKKEKI